MTDLRYPIGNFSYDGAMTDARRAACVARIAAAPAALRAAVAGLGDAQLDTPYRPGGWTVRQVVHHVPDSHLNAYIRIRLALTEDTPTIKPYEEARWAELPDARTLPVEASARPCWRGCTAGGWRCSEASGRRTAPGSSATRSTAG